MTLIQEMRLQLILAYCFINWLGGRVFITLAVQEPVQVFEKSTASEGG